MIRLAVALSLMAGAAAADWRVEPFAPPPGVFAETAARAGDLPDGLLATHEAGDIAAAWYETPTTRYAHGVLGDAIEAGALAIRTSAGAVLRLTLPETHVFEDRQPRLADLDGDGTVEVVTIRSALDSGGAVAIYGLAHGVLVEKAASPEIGRPNRWLNIAGIAPFAGGATREIAWVETPHIGGTLRLWRYDRRGFAQIAALYGFSNHAIGAREQRLSAVADVTGDGVPDLALPDASRSVLRLVTFSAGAGIVADIPLPSRVVTTIVERRGAFHLGLSDGTAVRVTR